MKKEIIYGLYDADGQCMAVGNVYEIANCMKVAIESIWRLCRLGSVNRGPLKGYKVVKIDMEDE